MKMQNVKQVEPPLNTQLLCATELTNGNLFFFLGKFNGEFWRSREYNVWELCNKPDYWSYLPTID